MPRLNAKIVLEIDGQEAAIIESALLDQALRCHDETRARFNRVLATKMFEARKRHHESAATILTQRYFGEGLKHAEHHRDGP